MKTKQKNRALFKDTLHCEVQGDLSTVERKSLEGAFFLASRPGRDVMYGIIQEKGPDGKMTYKFPNGEKIETYTENLMEIFGCGIERVGMVFKLLELGDDVDQEAIRHIGDAVIRDAEAQFNKAYDFIEENFGSIKIEGAVYHQLGIGGGKRLGVVFKANNQGK